MKKDKKIIDKLELTSLATGGLISMTKNYREALKKIFKENK